jgi:hypothetical protein
VLLACSPVAVRIAIGPPMHCAADNVITSLFVGMVITPGLDQIDFTRSRPSAICIDYWQHPDSWPDPIARGKLRLDFNSSVLNMYCLFGIYSSRLDRVDDRSESSVSGSNTVCSVRCSAYPQGCKV